MVGTYPDSQIPRASRARQRFWFDHLRVWHTQATSLQPAPQRTTCRRVRCGEHAGAVGDAASVEAKRLHHAVAVEQVAIPEPEPLVHRGAVAVEGAAKGVGQPSLDAGRALERIGPNAPPAEQRRVRIEATGEGLRSIGCSGPRNGQSRKGQRAEARSGDEAPACPASHPSLTLAHTFLLGAGGGGTENQGVAEVIAGYRPESHRYMDTARNSCMSQRVRVPLDTCTCAGPTKSAPTAPC